MPLTTIKVALDQPLLDTLNARAEAEGIPRAELIREKLSDQFSPAVIENYVKTCADVLRATNGKLTRQEVDHVVSVVIKGMAASSTK